jgi:hypothetical protein
MKYLNFLRTNLGLVHQFELLPIKQPPKIYIVDFKKLDELKKLKIVKPIISLNIKK